MTDAPETDASFLVLVYGACVMGIKEEVVCCLLLGTAVGLLQYLEITLCVIQQQAQPV